MQAGARVQEVADELRKHGLSLQNYASIREQTVGGFTQASGCSMAWKAAGCGFRWAVRGSAAESDVEPAGLGVQVCFCRPVTKPVLSRCAAHTILQVSAHGTGARIPPVDEQVRCFAAAPHRLGFTHLLAGCVYAAGHQQTT